VFNRRDVAAAACAWFFQKTKGYLALLKIDRHHTAADTEIFSYVRWNMSVRLLRAQGQFAQVMLVEFAVSVSGFVQRERSRDVDFKRTGLDQTVEPLDLLWTWLNIVALDLYARVCFWRRHYTVGVGHPSVLLHRAESPVGGFAAGRNQGGIQTVGRKSAGSGFDFILAAVCHSIGAKPFRQRHTIIARGHRKHSSPDAFG
jgi:hypothetical protein